MAKPKAAKSSSSKPQQTTTTPPAWPKFKPPLPVVDLLAEPHPRSRDKIVTVAGFFPRRLCRDYVAFLATLALQTTPGTPKRGDAVRVNDRFQVHDGAFATALWERTGLREALAAEDVRGLWYVSRMMRTSVHLFVCAC